MCTDETNINDALLSNGRSETLNHTSVVTCGNGGISSNAATSDAPACDPEVRSRHVMKFKFEFYNVRTLKVFSRFKICRLFSKLSVECEFVDSSLFYGRFSAYHTCKANSSSNNNKQVK